MARKDVVLLGIGHTNAHIVKEWQTNPIKDCQLTCISTFPMATYSGMLPGTLGQQFDDDEMRINLADLCQRADARLIVANTCGLDLQAGKLRFDDHEPVAFDALSIGVGSMPAGLESDNTADALVSTKPMQTFLQRLETAMHRKEVSEFAIVGGGVASIEIALCLHQQLTNRKLNCDFSITIFTSSETVAEGMKPRSIGRIEQILSSRGIPVATRQRVTEVGDDFIATEDGIRHDTDVVIWATGATAPPVLGKLGLETDSRGFIATMRTLQSRSDPRVFAVGDSGTIMDSPAPKAGVYAVRQCPVLSHNLRAFLDGGAMEQFKPQADFLKLLNTGDGKALLQYGCFTSHARWCWYLKTWIDKRFITPFQNN